MAISSDMDDGEARSPPVGFLLRMVMRVARARWFGFLRRVFQYQNGARSDFRSNPFNSRPWLLLEFIALAVQIFCITIVMVLSKKEKPVWPVRIWIASYNIANILSIPFLYMRFRFSNSSQVHGLTSDLEQQRSSDESRSSHLMNKGRPYLELFYALWFVMGNVWVFDSRLGSFNRAPKLHLLCVALLSWNAMIYSFPFLLFLLLCCIVPLVRNVLGYNMNLASSARRATDDQISRLPCWRFKEVEAEDEAEVDNSECCICLAKYMDREEVRQLPCLHLFHLRCVDQWLKITSCCPLCKKELEK
ncbi:E3 ubiquitin-protein ligase At1g63170-like [Phalaenopsis equestris]|uniref:E3 ubiquitin-protein ligase At1g63170-like n=1 Tax=Phalaenopsis equestris TaxID=78828 RepID=UPI0009E6053F|nr:E3 ubiquitin-protein ligase At1g63170-like [Phalaenopsis equestris]